MGFSTSLQADGWHPQDNHDTEELAAELAALGVASTRPAVHCVKAWPGRLLASATPFSGTKLNVVTSPQPFMAVRVGYMHIGGSGATAGTIGSIAATDDLGSLDYTVLDANFKKVCTPKAGGTTYNTNVTDGTPGWRNYTIGAIADGGAGVVTVGWSPIMQVASTRDAATGLYPLLIRTQDGTGAYTRASENLTDMQTARNYANSARGDVRLTLSRAGDCVTTPSNWNDSNTPTLGTASAPLLVEFYSTDDVTSVQVVGDSRFAISVDTPGYSFMSFEMYLQNALSSRGASVVGCSASGALSSEFYPYGAALINAGIRPKSSVYLVWSSNDGYPMTQALLDVAMYRAVAYVDLCKRNGIKPVVVTAWPRAGGYTAQQLTMLAAMENYVSRMSASWISPLRLYGDASGNWLPGYGYDTNHAVSATYQDLAVRIANII